MADGKARNGVWLALGLALLAGVWLFGVWPPPFWWRDHWPRETALQSDRRTAGQPDAVSKPVPLEKVSPTLRRMVILAEDWRFQSHGGVDFDAIREAAGVHVDAGFPATVVAVWKQRGGMRGASTITQQLAKNLYLTSSRSFLRKIKEAVTAVRLEMALDKDRIFELYLNVAEWGPGIWGAEQASRAYFHVSSARLTPWQSATLAATLPHPRTSNLRFRPERMVARRELILARFHGKDVVIPPAEALPEMPEIRIDPPPVRIPVAVDSLMADSIVISDTGSSQ